MGDHSKPACTERGVVLCHPAVQLWGNPIRQVDVSGSGLDVLPSALFAQMPGATFMNCRENNLNALPAELG